VQKAREAQVGKRAFVDLCIPEATLALKQGFGRLIRTNPTTGGGGDPRPATVGGGLRAGASWRRCPMHRW
jgi:hypothetical protein